MSLITLGTEGNIITYNTKIAESRVFIFQESDEKLYFAYRRLHLLLLLHYFKKTKDVHVYDTRGKSELYVCVQNLAISRQNPLSRCPKLYNLLPVSIRAELIFSF